VQRVVVAVAVTVAAATAAYGRVLQGCRAKTRWEVV